MQARVLLRQTSEGIFIINMAMLAEPKTKQKWSNDPRNTTWTNGKDLFYVQRDFLRAYTFQDLSFILFLHVHLYAT